ncbi:helix-turn-helix domain-containing protein [Halovulum sp. GXIMD14793]
MTVGDLAEAVGVPEHRLRATINGHLGHRNFTSSINSHRIAAAKDALSAPENARKTVLEIAFDTGFASLGPFNRAFRAEAGQSSTEFRRGCAGSKEKRVNS